MTIQSKAASSKEEKIIRNRLVLIAPIRRLAWSANKAVAVHRTATSNEMISPRYCIHS